MSTRDDHHHNCCSVPAIGLSLDFSRMRVDEAFLARMEPAMQRAFAEMRELEAGAIANPDENRMVGHYWLRNAQLAPSPDLTAQIRDGVEQVRRFCGDIHQGRLQSPAGRTFREVLCIGIGGSALGPMLLADALGHHRTDKLRMHFLDNTDPDGIERVLCGLELARTLCIVTSKSGGTPETRNGMVIASRAFTNAGLPFPRHAVAITMTGSNLDRQARTEKWLAVFPMFDWVGGRTSVTSAVGLLPAGLQGLDIDALLAGAAAMDEATRIVETRRNPAALLALMWYHATDGNGKRDMVVLPYADRLLLFSRYLQQLIMESLGKRLDRTGKVVEQGLTVYGNKGSTDQHAYVQQLRDGLSNFFVTFIRVLKQGGNDHEIEDGVTAGDYLDAFLLGTREALAESGRMSMTITIPGVTAHTMGALIALFERAVGLYAGLININAYHQPGVEAGKKAAAGILKLQSEILRLLGPKPVTADRMASQLGTTDKEIINCILERLAANDRIVREDDEHTGQPGYLRRTPPR